MDPNQGPRASESWRPQNSGKGRFVNSENDTMLKGQLVRSPQRRNVSSNLRSILRCVEGEIKIGAALCTFERIKRITDI